MTKAFVDRDQLQRLWREAGAARPALQAPAAPPTATFMAAPAGTEVVYVSVDLGVVEGVEDPVGLSASDLSPALGIVTASRLAGADLCGVVPGHGGGVSAAALAARLAADIVAAVARQRA